MINDEIVKSSPKGPQKTKQFITISRLNKLKQKNLTAARQLFIKLLWWGSDQN